MDEALFVEHVLEILLRGDTTTRFNAYGKAIQDGWMTRNEARRLENREPLPGLDETAAAAEHDHRRRQRPG